MKITGISAQVNNPDRVSISVDGTYKFSLDIYQLVKLGIKSGNEYTDEELDAFEVESKFGKMYSRALEYCLMRPHSKREIKDYLWKKTMPSKYKSRAGEIKEREGVSQTIADRVLLRLEEKGYVDDEKFCRFWIENRNQVKGSSLRKMTSELQAKGVNKTIIDSVLAESDRNDNDEIKKVINKKRKRFDDEQKLIVYLARQGFSYGDIKLALSELDV